MPVALSTHRIRAAALLVIVSIASAAAIGLAAWYFLPYEALEREGRLQQFLLWEAVMWMSGLALALFGVAAWFGATDLYARHGDVYVGRSAEHIRHQVQQGVRGRSLFADLPVAPWLMMGVGAGLVVQALLVRSVLLN